jgi:hypothetical protein
MLDLLRSTHGPKVRTQPAFDPADGTWYMIIDGEDSPARFSEEQIKAEMAAREAEPRH